MSLVNWMRWKSRPSSLASARQVLDQQVPAGEQAGERKADLVFFSQYDL